MKALKLVTVALMASAAAWSQTNIDYAFLWDYGNCYSAQIDNSFESYDLVFHAERDYACGVIYVKEYDIDGYEVGSYTQEFEYMADNYLPDEFEVELWTISPNGETESSTVSVDLSPDGVEGIEIGMLFVSADCSDENYHASVQTDVPADAANRMEEIQEEGAALQMQLEERSGELKCYRDEMGNEVFFLGLAMGDGIGMYDTEVINEEEGLHYMVTTYFSLSGAMTGNITVTAYQSVEGFYDTAEIEFTDHGGWVELNGMNYMPCD